ncbi:DUF2281 domain-containing protein [Iningainema tapete]|uniref:DUF2281 domain-containing protein n=1 Tax=Iningainema tapete BLCC-T55 TaxID=2748662 RepID=A0A8J7C911_9CYAN|nr:DUF2281 domain-containing protein [Iningainema tapete]MBD2777524.1 DUF2281 domain-containing protein [Iningainema tapete BLCC-T55]
MKIEQAVLEKLRQLPVDKQQEVLDFAEFLHQKMASKPPLRSVKGLWAGLDIDITEEDIAQARKEMWGNFPEQDI